MAKITNFPTSRCYSAAEHSGLTVTTMATAQVLETTRASAKYAQGIILYGIIVHCPEQSSITKMIIITVGMAMDTEFQSRKDTIDDVTGNQRSWLKC